MKNLIYILICLFICESCKSQERAIEYENLIIFDIRNQKIKLKDSLRSLLIHKNLIFVNDRRYVDIPRAMKIAFVKDKDTMNIVLNYGNWGNIYVKNFEFKKGNYHILADIHKNSQKIKLKKEQLPKQNIISKNEYVKEERKRRDIELKDMIFYEVDLNDTINVKLTEIK